jgi:transketolase
MRNIFIDTIFKLAKKDSKIKLITADLGYNLFENYEKKFPQQFLNVGVCEQNMIGIASGLALEKNKVITYSIGNFAFMRCLEQIRNDAAYHKLNLTVVANGGGFSYGSFGYSHHLIEDIAIMRSIPGATIHTPSTSKDVQNVFNYAVNHQGLNYIRLDRNYFECSTQPKTSIYKASNFLIGKKVQILSYGSISSMADQISKKLCELNISTGHSTFKTLKPIDKTTILELAKKNLLLVIIEEHSEVGGLKSIILETMHNYQKKTNKTLFFNLKDKFINFCGTQDYLRNISGLNEKNIISLIRKKLIFN